MPARRRVLHGQAAAAGVAYGTARVCLPPTRAPITEKHIPATAVAFELERLHHALRAARAEIRELGQRLHAALPLQADEFINLHALLLDDPELIAALQTLISQHHYCADYALQVQRNTLAEAFERMEDAYLKARLDDLDHVITRVHAFLQPTPEPDLAHLADQGAVLLCHTLAPAEVMKLHDQGIIGVVSVAGSHLSHTAILARSLRLPLVVGVGEALYQFHEGDALLMDGAIGTVVFQPSAEELERYFHQQRSLAQSLPATPNLHQQPARTVDGFSITLRANAQHQHDIAQAQTLGAHGIGLYRSEFLFMQSAHLPDEEEQFCAYRDAALAMPDQPVTIRTLDLGADKADSFGLTPKNEDNPALGLRGLRLTLAYPDIATTQFRAILRASQFGQLRMLLPMVSTRAEILNVKQQLRRLIPILRAEGHVLADTLPLGVMIEVPAAALALDTFIDQVDFLALGSNDLIQYVLAVDRNNAAVSALCSPLHPALIRLLAQVIHTAEQYRTPLYACGEIAADPALIPLLLALGLRELSLHPAQLLAVSQRIGTCHLQHLQQHAPALLHARDRRAIERWLTTQAPAAEAPVQKT